jgi:phosphoribosylamine--glycine ligase
MMEDGLMKILVIGSGGREHALCWKIAQSAKVEKIYCTPGNAGTAQVAVNVPIAADDIDDLILLVQKNKIDLTVVGPEAPLVAGIVDRFEAAGLRIFGPPRDAAQLEGSKNFAKEIMKKYGVPTANCETFTEIDAALKCLEKTQDHLPVLKADGLAAGKGVIIPKTYAEAKAACVSILKDKTFGEAGRTLLVEECLVGEEASILAFCDGEHFIPMVSAQDHKRVYDNDEGPNTGGMGAYSPAPVVTDEVLQIVSTQVFAPMIEGMKKEGKPYKGVLYAGIMLTKNGPRVLEFNCRFGDPETQPILMRLKSDLVEVMEACIDGRLDKVKLEWDSRAAVCVVMAAGGYPGAYENEKFISGLEEAANLPDTVVFHAGTRLEHRPECTALKAQIVTWGGRVLGVTALGKSIKEAIENTYRAVSKISFEGMHYRKDIGKKAWMLS